MGALQLPPTPPVDPANEEFVLFIRAVKFPQWYPLSVVKGGSAANVLVKAMEADFGKLLYGKTLVRNIGRVRAWLSRAWYLVADMQLASHAPGLSLCVYHACGTGRALSLPGDSGQKPSVNMLVSMGANPGQGSWSRSTSAGPS